MIKNLIEIKITRNATEVVYCPHGVTRGEIRGNDSTQVVNVASQTCRSCRYCEHFTVSSTFTKTICSHPKCNSIYNIKINSPEVRPEDNQWIMVFYMNNNEIRQICVRGRSLRTLSSVIGWIPDINSKIIKKLQEELDRERQNRVHNETENVFNTRNAFNFDENTIE